MPEGCAPAGRDSAATVSAYATVLAGGALRRSITAFADLSPV
jgi:hypothetical protein